MSKSGLQGEKQTAAKLFFKYLSQRCVEDKRTHSVLKRR